ncbi:MAG: DUF3598 family protein [Rivularia sp. ALOHA_DT_140]|nr:DUF3598 family protein [Rivularia sp. ALOHA_DT_140]
MELKDKNWENLTLNLGDWYGLWTRYLPEGTIKESFQSLRSFQGNPEKTAIRQTNRYTYAEDKIEEYSWDFNQQENNLPDGIYHPYTDSMRTICFESGHAAWVSKKLQPDSMFGAELFFRHEELRHSVAIIYDKDGKLFRTTNIREDLRGFPSEFWSKQIEQVPNRQFSEDWQGTSITITPDLKVSEPSPIKFNWNYQGHKTFFLPDSISISCPETIIIGNSFTFVANWLITSSQFHQLKARYDESGAFVGLTLEQFSR